jgi:DNA-directed RNA polymerase specialized sigma24 family protein
MKFNLADESLLKKINIYTNKFYRKHRYIFHNEGYEYEDFQQEVYLKLLPINIDEDLYSQGFLLLCIYSKMKTILDKIKKKEINKDDLNATSIENFWKSGIDSLNSLKDFLMDNLTFRQAFIVINKVFDNNTFEEIADGLACSKQNVFYHYRQALLKLKNMV